VGEKVNVDGLTCPRCGGPAADLRGAAFSAEALAYEHFCYIFKFSTDHPEETFTCNAGQKEPHG
jgi:hypothetical protein